MMSQSLSGRSELFGILVRTLKTRLHSVPALHRLLERWGPSYWRVPTTFRRRFVRDHDLPRLRDAKTFRTFPPETMDRIDPGPSPPSIPYHLAAARMKLPAQVITCLPAAWLVGEHATVITDDGQILLQSFRDNHQLFMAEPRPDIAAFLQQRRFSSAGQSSALDVPEHTHVLSLVNRLDPNYFHWMIEFLPQIRSVEAYEAQTGERVKILIREGGSAFIRDSLQLVGWGADRLLFWPAGRAPMRVHSMLAATIPGPRIAVAPSTIFWLRERLHRGVGIAAPPRATRLIYVDRNPSGGWRRIVNRDAVVETLVALGVDIIRPETLSLADQVRLFSETYLLIGMHGAGLTNALLSPDCRLLELMGDYGDCVYFSIAARQGMPYRCLRCATQGDDIVVDLARLKAAVHELLALSPARSDNQSASAGARGRGG